MLHQALSNNTADIQRQKLHCARRSTTMTFDSLLLQQFNQLWTNSNKTGQPLAWSCRCKQQPSRDHTSQTLLNTHTRDSSRCTSTTNTLVRQVNLESFPASVIRGLSHSKVQNLLDSRVHLTNLLHSSTFFDVCSLNNSINKINNNRRKLKVWYFLYTISTALASVNKKNHLTHAMLNFGGHRYRVLALHAQQIRRLPRYTMVSLSEEFLRMQFSWEIQKKEALWTSPPNTNNYYECFPRHPITPAINFEWQFV